MASRTPQQHFQRVLAGAFLSLGFVIAACSSADEVAPPTNNSDPNPTGAPPGGACTTGSECRSGVCAANVCQEASNGDGVKNGSETDVDCGGPKGPACAVTKTCLAGSDCISNLCVDGTCRSPGAGDGVKNGSETDVDCGGPGADVARCGDGKGCLDGNDCANKVCEGGLCKAPSPTDGIKNGDETDVDCGGAVAPKCGAGKACKVAGDCDLGNCKDNVCVSPSANDGIKNGGETDIDCGGPDPGTPRCAPDKTCNDGPDCDSLVCDPGTKKCKAPTANDGVKNGGETDVDCGGAGNAPRCAKGKTCAAHGDCASNGCAYDKTCASRPSCTALPGGYTCGPTESAARQNDCCESATVGAYTVDKYQITAGRMRAFLDRYNGNIRSYAQGLAANVWNQADTPKLPQDYSEANAALGFDGNKRSCQTGYHTGHVFWTPPTNDDFKDFSKDTLDTKALNCVPWWVMKAFCVWDGGHLATQAELRAAYTNNTTTAYPWGAIGAYTTNTQNDYAVQLYSYATPNPPQNARVDVDGYLDVAFYIAPPGRRPTGYSTAGHADLVGNLLEWVSDSDRQFVWKGSFENHAAEADGFTAAANDPYSAANGANPWKWGYNIGTGRADDGLSHGYYGIGGRCAR